MPPVKDIEIPEAMQRAMARQAEAERERRAKIINSEGEFQAAQKVYEAAESTGRQPDGAPAAAELNPSKYGDVLRRLLNGVEAGGPR